MRQRYGHGNYYAIQDTKFYLLFFLTSILKSNNPLFVSMLPTNRGLIFFLKIPGMQKPARGSSNLSVNPWPDWRAGRTSQRQAGACESWKKACVLFFRQNDHFRPKNLPIAAQQSHKIQAVGQMPQIHTCPGLPPASSKGGGDVVHPPQRVHHPYRHRLALRHAAPLHPTCRRVRPQVSPPPSGGLGGRGIVVLLVCSTHTVLHFVSLPYWLLTVRHTS
jgi:hypothetical protein